MVDPTRIYVAVTVQYLCSSLVFARFQTSISECLLHFHWLTSSMSEARLLVPPDMVPLGLVAYVANGIIIS